MIKKTKGYIPESSIVRSAVKPYPQYDREKVAEKAHDLAIEPVQNLPHHSVGRKVPYEQGNHLHKQIGRQNRSLAARFVQIYYIVVRYSGISRTLRTHG
jgi:hypothetical protein